MKYKYKYRYKYKSDERCEVGREAGARERIELLGGMYEYKHTHECLSMSISKRA